jgi:hypothetical protein
MKSTVNSFLESLSFKQRRKLNEEYKKTLLNELFFAEILEDEKGKEILKKLYQKIDIPLSKG